MLIRKITKEDTEKFIDLIYQTDLEMLDFGIIEADEIHKKTRETTKNLIEAVLASSNNIILVAEVDNNLVGYLQGYGGLFRRVKHYVDLSISILTAYRRQGIGLKLFQELDKWAIENKIHRLELRVLENNEPAIALYKKVGYKIEGVLKDSALIDNKYFDTYQMVKFF